MFLSIQTMLVVKLQNNKTIWFNYQGNKFFIFIIIIFYFTCRLSLYGPQVQMS